MATAQVFKQSHPGLGEGSRASNWNNNRGNTANGTSTQSPSLYGPVQPTSVNVQGMPSTMNPATAPVPAPRVQRRRGCQHCITCSGIQQHCHSTALRSSESPAAEWWPGGIQSPTVYYHLRARQLRYAQKFPHQAGIPWRGPREVHTHQSTLLNRRNQGPLAVLVPAVYTNVNQDDSAVHYLGDKVVPLTTRPAIMTPAPRPAITIAAEATAAIKRGMEGRMGPPPRLTWSHPAESPEDMLVSRRSSGSSITTCGMALDPKRRCTEQGTTSAMNSNMNSSSFLPAGHFIARTNSPPTNTATPPPPPPPRVYPGIVLQHHQLNTNLSQQIQEQQHQQLLHHGLNSGGSSGLTAATLMGVITPPLASMAPLSAGSDSSSTSVAPMCTDRSTDLTGATAGFCQWSAPMPTHAAAVWELTSAAAQPAQVESATVPVLSMVHNHHNNQQHNPYIRTVGNYDTSMQHMDQDPTMQQYYTRQYHIKQEQAFPCHQIVEIGPQTISAIGGYNSFGSGAGSNFSQLNEQQQEEQGSGATEASTDVGGWAVGLLKSLAGSIKRSVSP